MPSTIVFLSDSLPKKKRIFSEGTNNSNIMFVCHKLEIEDSGTMFSLLEKFSIYLPYYTFYSLVKHALSQLYKPAVYKAMTINGR